MILILEDDGDREALLGGPDTLLPRLFGEGSRSTIWTSPGAYARDAVLPGLRAKVAALLAEAEDDVPHGSARASAYAQVLVLIDQGWR
jgi:hypothetical protein